MDMEIYPMFPLEQQGVHEHLVQTELHPAPRGAEEAHCQQEVGRKWTN